MKKRLLLLFVLGFIIIGFSACAPFKLSSKIKETKAPAVIAVTPELNIVTLKINGQEAKRCSIPENGKRSEYEICPAFRDGSKEIDRQTITVIKSEGSICYTYYDRNRNAFKICIPPE